jgi:hypothetical protein
MQSENRYHLSYVRKPQKSDIYVAPFALSCIEKNVNASENSDLLGVHLFGISKLFVENKCDAGDMKLLQYELSEYSIGVVKGLGSGVCVSFARACSPMMDDIADSLSATPVREIDAAIAKLRVYCRLFNACVNAGLADDCYAYGDEERKLYHRCVALMNACWIGADASVQKYNSSPTEAYEAWSYLIAFDEYMRCVKSTRGDHEPSDSAHDGFGSAVAEQYLESIVSYNNVIESLAVGDVQMAVRVHSRYARRWTEEKKQNVAADIETCYRLYPVFGFGRPESSPDDTRHAVPSRRRWLTSASIFAEFGIQDEDTDAFRVALFRDCAKFTHTVIE